MANVAISNLTTTWNNVSTTFTGIKINVTDTASAAGSMLMDLQTGGVSKLKVTKAGSVISAVSGFDASNVTFGIAANNGVLVYSNGTYVSVSGQFAFAATSGGLEIRSDLSIGFNSGGVGVTATDVKLFRDAAATLAQRNGAAAQTHRIYGTYTDGSNYRRLTKTMSTGGVAEIKPEGAGTGASGNVLHISGLPTSNPGPGILWNNLGIVNVGT